jgi:hypothetical protein
MWQDRKFYLDVKLTFIEHFRSTSTALYGKLGEKLFVLVTNTVQRSGNRCMIKKKGNSDECGYIALTLHLDI